jgi:hypothetical protein
MMSSGPDGSGDDGLDGRKGGKRELSNSKRAAQNRAAQVRAILLCLLLLRGDRGLIRLRVDIFSRSTFAR